MPDTHPSVSEVGLWEHQAALGGALPYLDVFDASADERRADALAPLPQGKPQPQGSGSYDRQAEHWHAAAAALSEQIQGESVRFAGLVAHWRALLTQPTRTQMQDNELATLERTIPHLWHEIVRARQEWTLCLTQARTYTQQ